jgi:hypothetical protein
MNAELIVETTTISSTMKIPACRASERNTTNPEQADECWRQACPPFMSGPSPWRYRGSGGFDTNAVVGVSPTGLIDFSVGVLHTEIWCKPPLAFCFRQRTIRSFGLLGDGRRAALARACAASVVSILRQSSVGAASLVCL